MLLGGWVGGKVRKVLLKGSPSLCSALGGLVDLGVKLGMGADLNRCTNRRRTWKEREEGRGTRTKVGCMQGHNLPCDTQHLAESTNHIIFGASGFWAEIRQGPGFCFWRP